MRRVSSSFSLFLTGKMSHTVPARPLENGNYVIIRILVELITFLESIIGEHHRSVIDSSLLFHFCRQKTPKKRGGCTDFTAAFRKEKKIHACCNVFRCFVAMKFVVLSEVLHHNARCVKLFPSTLVKIIGEMLCMFQQASQLLL